MHQHWSRFGRHYYSRHDYESIASEKAQDLYTRVASFLPSLIGSSFASHTVVAADNFTYNDPVDGSITNRQGLRILLDDGSRVVLRLSGTGTQGATLRVYLERYISSNGNLTQDPQKALAKLIQAIDSFAEITKRTGMKRPTVIT